MFYFGPQCCFTGPHGTRINRGVMETQLYDVARPGMMVSQLSPLANETEGETLRVVECVLATDFFQAIQTVEVRSARERREVGAVVAAAGCTMTYCMARMQYRQELNLSDLEETARLRAVDALRDALDQAREQQANYLMLISGPAPRNSALRPRALGGLADSLDLLCVAAAQAPAVTILVEPLDVTVHKKGTLGYTGEAVQLVRKLRATHANIALCLDTSHMLLNGENPVSCLRRAGDLAPELHICNCCLDPAHDSYGDQHIPLGVPGPLDLRGVGEVLRAASEIGYLSPDARPGLYYETPNRNADVAGAVGGYRRVLEYAWRLACL